MTDTDWVSVHVFHHGDLDGVITGLAAPLFRAATGPGGYASSAFFLRYWEGGNHVRLRLRVPRAEHEQRTEQVLRECWAYLAEHPSTVDVDEAAYAAFAADVARWEGMAGFERHLRPDASAWSIAYRPEHDRYGHGAALAAAEHHFAESSALALAVLLRPRPDGWRGTLGFALLLTAWLSSGERPAALAEKLAVRPDALAILPGGGDVDLADWAASYQRQHETLDALCREVVAGPSGNGVLARWRDSLARLHTVLATEIENGNFTPPRRGFESGPEHGAGTLAVLDICAHLLCNRLGIGIQEESHLRFLAGRALGRLTEVAV